jgi:DNA repair exonuclease SbcCD ATPase subunit
MGAGEWQLSGGEQRRVALALTLAWAELALDRAGMRCNLLVLDEVGADERMR